MAAYKAFQAESEGFDRWETDAVHALGKVRDMLNAYLDQEYFWGPEYEVLGVELEFNLPFVEDAWVAHGTMDLVLRSPDDGVPLIVDHKTARRKWQSNKGTARQSAQAPWYSWAYFSLFREMPRFCFDIMTHSGEFERRWIHISLDEIDAIRNKAYDLADLIDATNGRDLPGNTTSPLCSEKWCGYWADCPMGAAMRPAL